MDDQEVSGAHPQADRAGHEPSLLHVSALTGDHPLRSTLLEVDCTGDETLWVFRYASYFKSVTGCDLAEAIGYANEAWDAWGQDPDCTPEEIASSDIAEMTA